MTRYTATNYITMIRNRAAEVERVIGFAGLHDAAAAVRPDGDGPDALVTALKDALYDAGERSFEHPAPTPAYAVVAAVVPMGTPDDDVTAAAAAAWLIDGGDGLDEALWDSGIELGEDAMEWVGQRFAALGGKGTPLAAAKAAYLDAVREALTEAMKGCWKDSGDEVQLDAETMAMLWGEEP